MKFKLSVGEIFTVSRKTVGLVPGKTYVVIDTPKENPEWPGHPVVAVELKKDDVLGTKEHRFHQDSICHNDVLDDRFLNVWGKGRLRLTFSRI